MDIQNVKHIRTVSTSTSDDFQAEVNALLATGAFVLLQIGFGIEQDQQGRVITPTIAVLGSEQPAPQPPQVVYRPMDQA